MNRTVGRFFVALLVAVVVFAVFVPVAGGQSADPTGPTTGDPTAEPPAEAPAESPVDAAATQPPIRTITAGGAACGLNLGVAFDGSRLLVSCEQDSRIDAVSPVDGSLLQTYNVPGLSGLGAIAYDGVRSLLYGCDDGDVVALDLAANTRSLLFSTNDNCRDGLAYDGVDDTFWASCDVCNTITHYSRTGSVIGTHDFNGEIGPGNSGIAVGGPTLYLANNGGQQIYTSDKAFTNVALFAELATRLEDMECDNLSFAAQGLNALWVIDAFDRTLNAFSIPVGSCSFGGAPAVEEIVVTPTFTG